MPIRMVLRGFICLTTLVFTGPGRTATDDPFPIWWSAELELDSLDQAEARLRRDLWLDFPEGLKLYKEQGSGHVTAQARNCNSLKELSEEGYYGGNSSNIGVQHYHRSVCRAIALLGQAKPARTSYLRGFVLNAEAVHYLPALVNLQPSCQAICQAYYKNKRGVPLTDFEDIERVEGHERDRIGCLDRDMADHNDARRPRRFYGGWAGRYPARLSRRRDRGHLCCGKSLCFDPG